MICLLQCTNCSGKLEDTHFVQVEILLPTSCVSRGIYYAKYYGDGVGERGGNDKGESERGNIGIEIGSIALETHLSGLGTLKSRWLLGKKSWGGGGRKLFKLF